MEVFIYVISGLLGIAGFGLVVWALTARQLKKGAAAGDPSRKKWMLVVGGITAIGLAALGFELGTHQNYWYQQGWDAGQDPRMDKLLYDGGLSVLSLCSSVQNLASDQGASGDDLSKVFSGCIEGLRDRLGSAEVDRMNGVTR